MIKPDNIILEGIVGSTAYGLNTKSSDIDKFGIYVEPSDNFWGLRLFTERDFSRVFKDPDPDHTYHEVAKFCRLALKCNPTVTELLWLNEYTVTSDPGYDLIWLRKYFLSAPLVRSAYMGYATAQFKRLSERGDFGSDLKNRTKKHARHLLRLMHQGFTLYSTGYLPIKLDNPERYHEFGEMVALTPGHAASTIAVYEELFDNTKSVLPDSPDTATIDEWLKDLRISY